MYPWLKDAVARNAVVITASRRLARDLQSAYAEQQQAAGRLSWLTPSILFWDDWCKRQLDAVADSVDLAGDMAGSLAMPIDRLAGALLWERCFRKYAPDGLPAMGGIIRQTRETWQRVNDWDVPIAAIRKLARSQDEHLFASAAMAYQVELNSATWVDRAGMSRLVGELVVQSRVDIPQEALIAGFDRYPPAITAVMDALKAKGCIVQAAPEAEISSDVRVAGCADHDAEMRTAGAWARDVLQQSPGARVAIVSPGLQVDASRTARLVREGLAPGWQYGGGRWRAAVNVSYGRKLSDFPAIAIALLLLRWIHHGLSVSEISLLLRSKSLGVRNAAGRSRLELAIRRLPDRGWTPDRLVQALQGRDDSADAVSWLQGLQAINALRAEATREASPAHWAGCIDALLNNWGWPGEKSLTSSEFQLINRWRELLNELAGTAIVLPALRLADALQRLSSHAAEVVFQPEAEPGVVSLMGTLEAAGMQFDHVWVTGLHAGLWPAAGNPSSLLSRELQRAYGMPDATPADTLEFSRRVLQRLTRCAPSVVLSWPRIDDESELAASSLLDEITHGNYGGPGDPGWHAATFYGKHGTAIVTDDPVPVVAADETVRGGAYTVQRQSTEPFAAFVYGRLGVTRAEAIETGISPSLRGNIVHSALYTLFSDRPTQAEVKAWHATNIAQRLGGAIDSAIAEHLRHADATLIRLLGLERARLFRLLGDFVAEEIARPDYTISDVEQSVVSSACGVNLSLRIDRIDRLPDGSLLIIDYKTGSPKNLLNKDGDPLDLQLVVYADALQESIGGLALINLDSRSISYKGTGGSVEWDAARQDQWSQRLEAWRADVHRALRELAAGDVRINLQLSADERRPLSILSRIEEHVRAH